MISPESYTSEWIMGHRKNQKFSKINPPVLEKMIHALALLEKLVVSNLQFTFKGGTSLILLLPEPRRFSVDIDILTNQSQSELESIFGKIVKDGPFKSWKLDAERSYKAGVPKAHYFFYFNSTLNKQANYVLLDILFEAHQYPQIKKTLIQSNWLKTSADLTMVDVPNIESICGDKLTAFAPNTTGVPYSRAKSLEIVKQLHDVGHLFDEIQQPEIVAKSFEALVVQEIKYRNLKILSENVLDDIIDTALLIGKPEKNQTLDEKPKYSEIAQGLEQLKGYLITGHFRLEIAIESAAKAAYLAAKIKVKDFSPLQRYSTGETDFQFESTPYNGLNRLRKIRNGSLFYWSKVAELLEIK